VESEEQLAFLREKGCDQYQGYLYRRPMPFEQISSLVLGGG
jgi:EAL domain-containing protein (putative c-di-GMP-specific phosphodiesterase class I)